jgi:hypothetical protein
MIEHAEPFGATDLLGVERSLPSLDRVDLI